MSKAVNGSRGHAGFSLLEALAVVAIGGILTMVALPEMSNIIANMRLRSSMTSVSGMLQDTRMVAVKQNKTKTACHYNWTVSPYSLIYFSKDAVDCTTATVAETDPQVELQAPITPMGTPTGVGAPGTVPLGQLGLSTNPLSSDPSFNSRGLPCVFSSGACSTNNGFIQYFKDNRIGGAGGWAAISISPAGRINRWFWNGAGWTN
jgi:prepilin-type N-terminal cleavage/methylation domain-containing protein